MGAVLVRYSGGGGPRAYWGVIRSREAPPNKALQLTGPGGLPEARPFSHGDRPGYCAALRVGRGGPICLPLPAGFNLVDSPFDTPANEVG